MLVAGVGVAMVEVLLREVILLNVQGLRRRVWQDFNGISHADVFSFILIMLLLLFIRRYFCRINIVDVNPNLVAFCL